MASVFLLQCLVLIGPIGCQHQNTSISPNSSITPSPIDASNTHPNKAVWSSFISTEVPLFVLILALLIITFCCCICFLCYMNVAYKRKIHRTETNSHHEESVSSNSKSNDNDDNDEQDKTSLRSPRSEKSDFDVVRDMELEMAITKGSITKIVKPSTKPNTSIPKQHSMSSTVYGMDGHEIKSPPLIHNHDSPSTVRITKKSPSTIIIKAGNKYTRRSSNRLQVANKSAFDSPDIKLSTLPNDESDLVQSYDASLMTLDGGVLRGTYESEGRIINRMGTNSFSQIRTLKKNSEGGAKHTKGQSIIDQIYRVEDFQSDMPDLDENEFEVVGTPSVDPVIRTKK